MQDILPYLFNASYENFHQLQEIQSKEIFPPEQYMELIINVSIPIFLFRCYRLKVLRKILPTNKYIGPVRSPQKL